MPVSVKKPEHMPSEHVNNHVILDKPSLPRLLEGDSTRYEAVGHPTYASSSPPRPPTNRSTDQVIAVIAKQTKKNPLAPPFYNNAIAAADAAAAMDGNIGDQSDLKLAVWLQDPQAPMALVRKALVKDLVKDLDAVGENLENIEHDFEAVEYFATNFDAIVNNMQEMGNIHLLWDGKRSEADSRYAMGGDSAFQSV